MNYVTRRPLRFAAIESAKRNAAARLTPQFSAAALLCGDPDDPSATASEIIDIGPVETGLLDANGDILYRVRETVGFAVPRVK